MYVLQALTWYLNSGVPLSRSPNPLYTNHFSWGSFEHSASELGVLASVMFHIIMHLRHRMRNCASTDGLGYLYSTLSLQTLRMEIRLTQVYALIMMGETSVEGVQQEFGKSGCDSLRHSTQHPLAVCCQPTTRGVLTWNEHLVAAYNIPCWTSQDNITELDQLEVLNHHQHYEKLRLEGHPDVPRVLILDSHVGEVDEWCATRALGMDATYWEENQNLWFQLTGRHVRTLPCV